MKQINEILADIDSLEESTRQALISELFRKYNYSPIVSENPDIIDTIKTIVCNYLGVSSKQIMSETRKKEIVFARQLIMYFARRMTLYSQDHIGMQCGERDHATVIHACAKIDKLIQKNIQVKEIVRVLTEQLKVATFVRTDT